MRNLTITRRKSFVGCAMKDQVYIRDELSHEITIDGVPCRKIGEIKNGESKTFPIGEGEQQVFLIVDKLSKNYCNATVTVPAGPEDAALSGVHKFVLGSNPFCFDGVQLSAEQQAKQKKNGRKGAAILAAVLILSIIAGSFLGRSLFRMQEPSPKTFTEEDFRITLTDAFDPTEEAGLFACYESKSAAVFAVREDKSFFDGITLDEYGALVLEANGKTGIRASQEDGLLWFEYTDTPEDQEIYYLSVCCESEDAFWIVNFATPASNRETYRQTFLDWAKTIRVG